MKRHGGNLNANYYVKEANVERLYSVWFQLYGILEKAELWRQKKISGCQVSGVVSWRGKAQRIFRTVKNTLYATTMMDACNYTSVQAHTMYKPRVSPKINYGLWVIIMFQCKFINFNAHASSWGMLIMGGCACVGQDGYVGNLCTFFSIWLWS